MQVDDVPSLPPRTTFDQTKYDAIKGRAAAGAEPLLATRARSSVPVVSYHGSPPPEGPPLPTLAEPDDASPERLWHRTADINRPYVALGIRLSRTQVLRKEMEPYWGTRVLYTIQEVLKRTGLPLEVFDLENMSTDSLYGHP